MKKTKYEIVVKNNVKKEIKERTFCFGCGCFQGIGGDRGSSSLT